MNRNVSRAVIIGVIAAIGVLISMAVGSATHAPDTIILTIEDGTNTFTDGVTTQEITVGKAACSIDNVPQPDDLIVMTASTYTNAGTPKDDAPIGLVEDGLGVNLRGNGNGQDCGRVDYLDGVDSDGNLLSERLMFSLGGGASGHMITSVDFDLEAKYEATIRFWFYRNGVLIDNYPVDIGEGSDSGPDSKFRDKYSVTASTPEGLFDAIEISMDSGGASVEGGATWDEKPGDSGDNHRTVFNLIAFLGCGDGDIEGEPGLADTPLVSFIVGPDNGTKEEPACAVPVHITSTNDDDYFTQVVGVTPLDGYVWGGVTGLVTIQWDAEDITLGPIARTVQVLDEIGNSETIPWCASIIPIEPVLDVGGSDLWNFQFVDPVHDASVPPYSVATASGDTCLVFQYTETVDDDGTNRTQTTEVFYIWNDPIYARP